MMFMYCCLEWQYRVDSNNRSKDCISKNRLQKP